MPDPDRSGTRGGKILTVRMEKTSLEETVVHFVVAGSEDALGVEPLAGQVHPAALKALDGGEHALGQAVDAVGVVPGTSAQTAYHHIAVTVQNIIEPAAAGAVVAAVEVDAVLSGEQGRVVVVGLIQLGRVEGLVDAVRPADVDGRCVVAVIVILRDPGPAVPLGEIWART